MSEQIEKYLKTAMIGSMIGAYMASSAVYTMLEKKTWKRKLGLADLVSAFSRVGLRIIGCEIIVDGNENIPKGNFLTVSNHMSYFDVMILASQFPSCFVTSVEIKETPFLGQICQLAGCVFVERRNKRNLRGEIKELTDALKNGINVTIFPEATSTNGDQVLRFRRPLYHAAIESGRPILPVCINYLMLDDDPVTAKNRDDICWYGDMAFFPHLMRLLAHKRIRVQLSILQPLNTTAVKNADEELPNIVDTTQQRVAAAFRSLVTSH